MVQRHHHFNQALIANMSEVPVDLSAMVKENTDFTSSSGCLMLPFCKVGLFCKKSHQNRDEKEKG